MAEPATNGAKAIYGVVGLLALIGGIGSIILPIQGSIDGVNDRLNREVQIIEREISDLDRLLQTEIGALADRIAAADELSGERDRSQGQSFKNQLKALDDKLQAEGALIRSEAISLIRALEERINALRDFVGIGNAP